RPAPQGHRYRGLPPHGADPGQPRLRRAARGRLRPQRAAAHPLPPRDRHAARAVTTGLGLRRPHGTVLAEAGARSSLRRTEPEDHVLNNLDDYPVHQTPEPLAQLATTDRNAYDRTWFNGYSSDGTRYFG